MNFRDNRPIYLQIADYILDNVITRKWLVNERIPSVRELASEIEVNPNTVARTYNMLSEMNLIYNKRGIGYFLSDDALIIASEHKRTEFIKDELPQLFHQMDLLNLDFDQIIKLYNEHKKT